MRTASVKAVLWGFLVLGLNLLLAYSEITIWGMYTTPGNSVRPRQSAINLIGLMGFFIGLSQVFYIAPLLVFAVRSKKWVLVKGLIWGAILTILLNIILLKTH